jgi:hypothetical protein
VVVPAVDESDWPIVRIRWPEEMTLDDVTTLGGLLDRIFERRGPLVLVSDISALSLAATTPVIRRAVAIEADKLTDRGALIGSAVVIRTRAARLIYEGYLWLRTRHAYPIQLFEDQAKAEAWARSLLRAKR